MNNTLISILLALLVCPMIACGSETIKLNPPETDSGLPVMKALSIRMSDREFDTRDLDIQVLSNLLWAANGINRPESGKRTAASAMNSQDIDIYVFMAKGVYLYDAKNNVLNLVTKRDHRTLLAGRQASVASAPVNFLLVSDISRFKHGDEFKRMTWAAEDAGIVSQNIALFCAAFDLGTVARASMDLEEIRKLLNLTESQKPMLNNPVGYKLTK